MNVQRLDRVRQNLRDLGLTQTVVTDPVSIAYLTGYDNDPMERFEALYLAVDSEPVLFVNRLFPDPGDCVPNVVTLYDTDDPVASLAQVTIAEAPLGIDRTMEARWLLPLMEAGAASSFRLASSAVDDARARKDADEREAPRPSTTAPWTGSRTSSRPA